MHPPNRNSPLPVLARRRAAAFLAGVLFAACTSAAPPANPARGSAARDADNTPSYRLGVGDVVRVAVWKEPELDVEVPIAPDGNISLPLVGEVSAAGLTLSQLRETVTRDYARYVTSPAVSVVLKEIHSQKVFVTGEVRDPGVYELDHGMTLMQAIALAGGFTPYAKRDRVVLIRETGGAQRNITVDVEKILSGVRPETNFRLSSGDTIVVP